MSSNARESILKSSDRKQPLDREVIELLKNDDEVVRYRGARLLARLGRKASPAVPKLAELLNDKFPQVQTAAIEALAAIGPAAKAAVIELAKKLEAEDRVIAREAAQALQSIGPAAAPAAPALAKALDSDEAIGCIVITGAGDRAFSAGGDIHEQREDDRRYTQDELDAIRPPRRGSYEIAASANCMLNPKDAVALTPR